MGYIGDVLTSSPFQSIRFITDPNSTSSRPNETLKLEQRCTVYIEFLGYAILHDLLFTFLNPAFRRLCIILNTGDA